MTGRMKMAAKPPVQSRGADNKAEQKRDDVFRLKSFLCPISQEEFVTPVIANDGHTYEEKEFKRWMTVKQLSPVTLLPLGSDTTQKNHVVTQLLEEYETEVVPRLLNAQRLEQRLTEIELDVAAWKIRHEEKERELKSQNDKSARELQLYKERERELQATVERFKQELRVKNEELERLRQAQVMVQPPASSPSPPSPAAAAPLNSLLFHPELAPATSVGIEFFPSASPPRSAPIPAAKTSVDPQRDEKHSNPMENKSLQPAPARPVPSSQVVEANRALKKAIRQGRVGAVRLALAAGAKVNTRFGAQQETPMMLAVGLYATNPKAAQEMMALLMESRVNLDLVDACGDSALHRAVEQNQEWPVRFLLRKGANPLLLNGAGRTPSSKILTGRHFNSAVVGLLLRGEKLFSRKRGEDAPPPHSARQAHSVHSARAGK